MLEWWSKRSSSHHKHAAVSTKEDGGGGGDDEHLWRVIQASDSKKERKAKLHHSYERNACIVKLEARQIILRDHQEDEDEDDEGEEEDLAQGVVVIPRPKRRPHSSSSSSSSSSSQSPLVRSKQNNNLDNDSSSNEHEDEQEEDTTTKPETPSTHVPNCCIICLEHYRPGDTIVWSHHVDCQHAFHRKCVTKYLVKMMQRRNASTPCPVCRRPFTDLEVEPRTKRRRRRQRTATERRRRSEEESASSSRVCEWWTRVVSFFCR